ncbi:hypothetical protein HZH68_014711 [Vespula germanica]|uniref:Protein transport protein Sec61 subunit gamma n=1 Tax=Vespula germanica TaxID=30212 RepID=A0A834JBG3_VESGE|nr:hypothetical protein HZH68_014711 [Vespula germanica]
MKHSIKIKTLKCIKYRYFAYCNKHLSDSFNYITNSLHFHMQLKCDLFSMIRRNLIIMDQVKKLTEPGRQFAKDSIRLVKRCTKPDRKEFQKIAIATAIGFCIMGFIGFFVKLIHIPINNIIVGS